MANGSTTTVTVNNLSTTPISYAVTIGDVQVTVGPNGMVTFVPPGTSGLVGTFEFAVPEKLPSEDSKP